MAGLVSERRAPLLLLVVLTLLLALLARQVRGEGGDTLLHRALRGLVSPVVGVTSGASGGMSRLWEGYVDLRGARAERDRALRERDEARALALLAEEALRENGRLRRLLALRDRRPDAADSVAARVVGGAGDLLSDGLLLDRGERHDVRPGRAVVASAGGASGLVGRVVFASRSRARVQLLTDRSASVAVTDPLSGAQGMVRGLGGRRCEFTWIDRPEELAVGALLVTSGLDGLFPPGLPVATVQEPPSPSRPGEGVEARPVLDPGAVEEVLVLPRVRRGDAPESARDGARGEGP